MTILPIVSGLEPRGLFSLVSSQYRLLSLPEMINSLPIAAACGSITAGQWGCPLPLWHGKLKILKKPEPEAYCLLTPAG